MEGLLQVLDEVAMLTEQCCGETIAELLQKHSRALGLSQERFVVARQDLHQALGRYVQAVEVQGVELRHQAEG